MLFSAARTILARDRLHDPDMAQWSLTMLTSYLNSAIRRTLSYVRAIQDVVTMTIVEGTAVYDASPIFNVKAVRLGANVLNKKELQSLPVITENWDALANGTPTEWIPMGGTSIRISPPPDATQVSVAFIAYGPQIVDDLDSTDDISQYISDAHKETYLKAAEEEAWNARPSMPSARSSADIARAVWKEECAKLKDDLGIRD